MVWVEQFDSMMRGQTSRMFTKLSDENGNVIPTGPKGRPKGSTQENSEKATANLTRYYKDLLNEKDAVIQQKSAENNLLSEKLKEAEKTLQRYKSAVKASEKIWAGLA